jgi:hypothetical protein
MAMASPYSPYAGLQGGGYVAAAVDMTSLGPTELSMHSDLQASSQQITSILESMSAPPAPLSKLQLAGLDRQIKELLARMRAQIRDLELLAEEQDT